MKQNVGGIDKYARMALGAALVVIGTAVLGNIFVSVAGVVVMSTGVFRFCGLYSLLGINTACKIKSKEA